MGRPRTAPAVRFFRMVKQDGDCWTWTGHLGRGGYASFGIGPERIKAHRWAWEYLRGPIPDGLQLDHLCRRPSCVNPWHLEPVTARVNTLRGTSAAAENAAKTHCKNGHRFDEGNTIRAPKGRQCRTCARLNNANYKNRKKAVA